MKPVFILSLISLLFLAVKCPKPDKPTSPPEVLPPATQTGANTFGCLRNGQVWLPYATTGLPPLIAQYYKGDFTIAVKRNNPAGAENISWDYKPIYKVGTYYFKSAPAGGSPGVIFSKNTSSCVYRSDSQDSLNTYVTITKLDSINRIISGTFNLFFLPSATGCDTIRITSGRFDTVYTY